MSKWGIRWILFIALASRLYHIDFPVAGFQAWRQADTAAMARNFYENGFTFLYPQIDWGGNSSGYVETEFPLYPFLVALLYAVFWPADIFGRLLSVLCALVTIYGLYLLVRKYCGERAGLWSAFLYAIIPLNIFYSRAFMPESAMLMFSVLGVYWFSEWMDGRGTHTAVLSALSVSLAVLLKITSLYLGLVLFFLAWRKDSGRTFTQGPLWLYAAAVLAPVVLWYYHAHSIYLQSGLTFGIWMFGSDKWGIFEPLLTLKFYNDIFFKSIAERHLTYAGFIPFLIGLFVRRKTSNERLFDWWIVALLVYFAIVTVGNQVHEYYQLPFAIPASVFIAKVFDTYLSPDSLRSDWNTRRAFVVFLLACLLAVPILSFLRVHNFMKGENRESALFHLADAVQAHTDRKDLVVAVDEGDPIIMYRCDRKGWHSHPESLSTGFLQEKISLGAKFLIGRKSSFASREQQRVLERILVTYPARAETSEFFVLSLVE